ncbi:MAG: adenosine deaminase [Chloroflexota bacterium]
MLGTRVEKANRSSEHVIAAMPKAELHVHLDGCVRLDTVADLAAEQKLALPVPHERLSEVCVAPPECQDLMHVLSYFATPLSVLQTAGALERVTYELCEDLSAENVRYLEIRFGPSLHQAAGLSLHDIIAAVVRGWHAARQVFNLSGGIILCALRQRSPADTRTVAEAGLPFLGNGVVGFDLAGDEARFSVLLHRESLLWARAAGYRLTVHAGEAAGPQSVRDAIETVGADRIGHGVRSEEDPSMVGVLRDTGVTLEMCPTSNVHTCAIRDLESHPLMRYYRAGVNVTVNSDNRTVSSTTMTRELLLSHKQLDVHVADLARMTLTAVEAGFDDLDERRTLLRDFRHDMESLGITPSSR